MQSGSLQESGKQPIPLSLCEQLRVASLVRWDGGFSHVFWVTQWNMMSRSEAVQTICTEHFSAQDDSIGWVMHKSKTNQEGSGPKDPRRLCGNPHNPGSLPWSYHPTQPAGPLFPGARQKARFAKILGDMIKQIQPKASFGTHSIRKESQHLIRTRICPWHWPLAFESSGRHRAWCHSAKVGARSESTSCGFLRVCFGFGRTSRYGITPRNTFLPSRWASIGRYGVSNTPYTHDKEASQTAAYRRRLQGGGW
ncbi:TPA: hypothetical protein N0F65_001630 [Lagenidium giganteum]|uniref:Uncharacterized protein n=1 Tax=Lagenidium giganteum TaxID=4803 RepID=A0AAV2YMV8_9STRA|nr:TPA: hypothetical protein N0F65_001630 [Lagenidium giganteum]